MSQHAKAEADRDDAANLAKDLAWRGMIRKVFQMKWSL